MENNQLKSGEKITINIPFEYEIGDEGYYIHKPLNTISECEDELRAELGSNDFNPEEAYLKYENSPPCYPKYSIDQEVYFLHENEIKTRKINKIRINMDKDEINIEYIIPGLGIHLKRESELFGTKLELLNSL